MLANVLEGQGLSTVALSLIRAQAEVTRPPRALHCEFPLGRPLGKPGDPAFQHRVLSAAFALLDHDHGPVLVDFDESVRDEDEQPLSCPVPLAADSDVHPAVAEAIGLRDAYDRQLAATGRTSVGRVIDASQVGDALETLAALVEHSEVSRDDLPDRLAELALDVRGYFEEAAAALADHVPAARQAEAWFFQATQAGRLLIEVKTRLREAGFERGLWWPIAPLTQEREEDRETSWRVSRGT